ncbi:MAG: extensin family protein [Polyangiales bacterium]
MPERETCVGAAPREARARALRTMACEMADTGRSSVLTPNYNEGHRDHFHVDIRPDDPRLFLR